MGTLLQDLRYGLRVLLQRPGFTLVAVLALALGIGANTAIFSVVHSVVLRPLPYPDAERLVTVWDDNQRQGWHKDVTGYSTFSEWQAQSDVFEALAAHRGWGPSLTGAGEPERLLGTLVTPAFFDVLRILPLYGRTFQPEDGQEGQDRIAVLGHGLWQRRFGGDPAVVGQTLRLDDAPVTVVGIMPEGFGFPSRTSELWSVLSPPREPDRGNHYLEVVGRLRPGVGAAQADRALDALTARLAGEFPRVYEGFGVNVVPLHEHLVGDVRPALLVLLGAVLFVLLIACANVANLLLARTAGREREIAVRTALGAGRGRIVRQLLTESVLLGLAGGALGLLLALWGGELLVSLAPGGLPRLERLGLNGPVLLFTLGASLLTGILFGLAPALQASRPDLNESLKEAKGIGAGVRGRRVRSLLIVAEVALALVLLVGAGLLMQSFARLQEVEAGFDTERLLSFHLSLPSTKYPEDPQIGAFHRQALERLGALPGVESAAAVMSLPLTGSYSSATFSIEGQAQPPDAQSLEVKLNVVSDGYLGTMGIPLKSGRFFGASDAEGAAPVAVVNETMARLHFPGVDPVGKRFKWGRLDSERYPWREVVGVVGDVRHKSLEAPSDPEVYMPLGQEAIRAAAFVLRTATDPATLAPAVRREVQALDSALPIYGLRTMDELLSGSLAQRRFNLWLLGLFASVALLLAAVGIYGVMSTMVGQRTREIGIRMALGARRADVLRMILGEGVGLVLVGVGIGLAGAIALSRALGSLLYEVSRTDPVTYGAVAVVLVLAAALACYVPARRAMGVDPMQALRYE
jgi:putative ABC transport system permease protein